MHKDHDAVGICQLTLRKGRFVKAHIIPRALTSIAPASSPIALLNGSARPPIRRWSSWYDPALVIRAGEDILRDYDTWGIQFLRNHHLVWSSWNDHASLPNTQPQAEPIDFREVPVTDPRMARLFFLSLLWRAAATNLTEFATIEIPDHDLEVLRTCLVERSLPAPEFYPMTLFQLVTRGEEHIWAPCRTDMATFTDDGVPRGSIPLFRFYFDGLSLLVRLPHEEETEPLGDLAIGGSERLLVQTLPFEASRQLRDLQACHGEALRSWPKEMAKLGVTETPVTRR